MLAAPEGLEPTGDRPRPATHRGRAARRDADREVEQGAFTAERRKRVDDRDQHFLDEIFDVGVARPHERAHRVKKRRREPGEKRVDRGGVALLGRANDRRQAREVGRVFEAVRAGGAARGKSDVFCLSRCIGASSGNHLWKKVNVNGRTAATRALRGCSPGGTS